MKPVANPEWVRHADGWTIIGEMLASRYITHAWPTVEWFGINYSQNFAGLWTGCRPARRSRASTRAWAQPPTSVGTRRSAAAWLV